MSTSSSEADDASSQPAPDEADAVSPWVVRFFLILAFGLAFGIEGMTLVRSYLLNGEAESKQAASQEERVETEREEGAPLRRGEDLLPATDVSERVAQMSMRARPSGPWAFRLVVAVQNDTDHPYRLTLRALETEDGAGLDDVHTATCAPGDSTRLVATWRMGADARPRGLMAEAELGLSGDSTRTVRRRVMFGHVPVQMER